MDSTEKSTIQTMWQQMGIPKEKYNPWRNLAQRKQVLTMFRKNITGGRIVIGNTAQTDTHQEETTSDRKDSKDSQA